MWCKVRLKSDNLDWGIQWFYSAPLDVGIMNLKPTTTSSCSLKVKNVWRPAAQVTVASPLALLNSRGRPTVDEFTTTPRNRDPGKSAVSRTEFSLEEPKTRICILCFLGAPSRRVLGVLGKPTLTFMINGITAKPHVPGNIVCKSLLLPPDTCCTVASVHVNIAVRPAAGL
jgi:hypothetical protein